MLKFQTFLTTIDYIETNHHMPCNSFGWVHQSCFTHGVRQCHCHHTMELKRFDQVVTSSCWDLNRFVEISTWFGEDLSESTMNNNKTWRKWLMVKGGGEQWGLWSNRVSWVLDSETCHLACQYQVLKTHTNCWPPHYSDRVSSNFDGSDEKDRFTEFWLDNLI